MEKVPEDAREQARAWLAQVGAAHAASADEWHEGGVTVRRAYGGANNALYRVDADGQICAVKLCAPDDRRRAAREYSALRLLRQAGLDIAAAPLLVDESCATVPFPAVVYRWLSGSPIEGKPDARQLAALSETYASIHSLKPGDFPDIEILDAVFHWFDFAPYVAELRQFMDDYGPWLRASLPGGGELRNRLTRLVDGCAEALMAARVEVSRENVPLRLCRVDPNLGNAIWCEDGRLRWVDWEYSGWGDPALDLADLRWHGALERLSEPRHAWLRMNYRRPPDDPAFDQRLALWDRLLATRWPLLVLRWLWSQDNGPDRVRLSQVAADPAELRARLTRLIERGERFSGICSQPPLRQGAWNMSWKNRLNGDPIPWLLEMDPENPGPRLFALRELLERPADAPEVVEAQHAVMAGGPVPKILDAQYPEGYWVKPGPGYSPKYRSTVWSVMFLAQLGADGADARVRAGCGYLLDNARAPSGGFSVNARPSGLIQCLQGNLCAALIDLGWLGDPRLDEALDWLARSVTGEGIAPAHERDAPVRYYRSGNSGPGFACSANDHQPCAWGAVKTVLALGKVPESERTPPMKAAIDAGVDFLLSRDPAVADYPHPYAPKPSQSWFRFGYPVAYVTDLLQNLEALTALGMGGDPRLRRAIDLVLRKQDAQGRWAMTYSYNGKMWADVEEKKQPSKWVTLRALRVLKRVGEAAG